MNFKCPSPLLLTGTSVNLEVAKKAIWAAEGGSVGDVGTSQESIGFALGNGDSG